VRIWRCISTRFDRLYIAQCRKRENEEEEKLLAAITKARANLSSALTALAFAELEQRPVIAAKLALAAWPREAAMDLPKREVTMNAVSRSLGSLGSLAGLHERMRIAVGASVYSVAFSPDGARVLTGSHDYTARLWDVATGKEIRAFKGHEDDVNSTAFSPDGKCVLTGSDDNTARLWDVATGQELRAFKGHETFVTSVAFSPDGARVLTAGSWDQTARLWDVATSQELRAFKGHETFVTSVAFSPDGKCVLIGSFDKTARLWDAAMGKELRAFRGHEGPVWSIAFSPDGARALTGSSDTTARLWDAATGKEIRAFKGHEEVVTSVAFSPDGARVLTGSLDNTARLWDISAIPPGSIFEIACAWLPDHDLSGLGKDYGLDLSSEAPICQKDASGKFTTPLPDPSMAK
jgi:sugar lactone lactonase YvrE